MAISRFFQYGFRASSNRAGWVAAFVALGMAACGGGAPAGGGGTQVLFEVPRGGVMPDFYSLPFPTSLRFKQDGTLDLTGFPQGTRPDAIRGFLEGFARGTPAASTGGAAYFRFGAPIDPASLPTSSNATSVSASAFIINVDPASPDRGKRHPLSVRHWKDATVFVPTNVLALMPYPGIPLRPKTQYAAVVTRAVKDASGKPVVASPTFELVKSKTAVTDADVERVRQVYAAPLDALESFGVARADVSALAVFTTQDPTAELARVRAWIAANALDPVARNLNCAPDSRLPYIRCDGEYEVPSFRAGTPPYATEGGHLVFDASGHPVEQGREKMTFVLTLPKTEPPTGGFPVALISHGTGGTRESFLGSNDTGETLARRGIAAIGIDQPLHGLRDTFCPSGETQRDNCEGFYTFNPTNFVAARDNFRQGAIDLFLLTRLVQRLTIPASTTGHANAVRFDEQRILFFGHSQGGIVGPMFVALEPSVKSAILSGGGAILGYGILLKTAPTNIKETIELLLGIPSGELELAHPLITLLQGFIERADPLNYAGLITSTPLEGHTCKDVLITEGLGDSFTPNVATEALATAAAASPALPVLQEVAGLLFRDRSPLAPPISANLASARGGPCTAVLAQYARAPDAASNSSKDGHFVVYWSSTARKQYGDFLKTFVDGGRSIFPTP